MTEISKQAIGAVAFNVLGFHRWRKLEEQRAPEVARQKELAERLERQPVDPGPHSRLVRKYIAALETEIVRLGGTPPEEMKEQP